MMVFRFVQGIGTGGEVPVASAYMNEFVSAKRRGRFFLLYEVLFLFGLLSAGLIGYFLVPIYGWKAMFIVGLIPAILTIPMRWFMVESPRWLLSVGRVEQASDVVARMESGLVRRGKILEAPVAVVHPLDKARSDIRELFRGIYLSRTVLLVALWVCSYMIANGLITWLPTLYRQVFQLPLQTSLGYGFTTSACGCIAALFCALYIDHVGRKLWYTAAFFLAAVPMAILAVLGATSAQEVLIFATATYAIIQTVTFSLYLYSAELYPTRLRAVGAGFGSAWLRIASSIGPLLVGWIVGGCSINYVFVLFGIVLAIGGAICLLFAIETKGRVLEELSP
jgi:putative MFS transporter